MRSTRRHTSILLASLLLAACEAAEEPEAVGDVGGVEADSISPGMVTGTTGAPGPGTVGTPGTPAAVDPDTIGEAPDSASP